MQLGIVGLGRMGGNMARRLIRGGHDIVGYASDPAGVRAVASDGGTGTTTLDDFVRALRPPRVAWVMVPAGAATEQVVTDLAKRMSPGDTIVDGADEVDGRLNLIKGHGGALVRERIVAAASRRQIILVTPDKLVETLGARGPLPVEVLPFAAPFCRRRLEDLELKPTLRMLDERPFVTDNFNVIFDCAPGPIDDAVRLEQTIRAIPGVIDTGLFLGTAAMVVVADGSVLRELVRRSR